ncbi:MAG TPA: hypothetical protein DD387_08180 [Lachnoclostridium sp.]|nr:hypothetical protein DW922_01125 [Clostridium sp. AM42-4]HBM47772.1 hypothetical protein [Lachnoclostridium sp.]
METLWLSLIFLYTDILKIALIKIAEAANKSYGREQILRTAKSFTDLQRTGFCMDRYKEIQIK